MIYKTKSDGNIYKELRKKKGLTQKEVAFKLCLKAQAVSKWETGISTPDQSMLPKIAELYETTVDYLLTGKGEAPKERKKYYQALYEGLSDTYKEMAVSALEGIYIANNGPIPYSIKEIKEEHHY